MYSLDINFLKDRPAFQKNSEKKVRGRISLPGGDLTPFYVGGAIAVALPVLVGTVWWFLEAKNSELDQNIAQLEQENKKLEAQIGDIKKIKEETSKIKQETQALVSVFDRIRPWSAMLQDLRDRIPTSVQIQNIKQIAPIAPTKQQPSSSSTSSTGGVEISGLARSFNNVNDFMLTLQQSRFLKGTETKIISAELVDPPLPPSARSATSLVIKPPQIVKYTIQSSLSEVPASELIRELEQKGTVGLVTRIRSMQQTGVIQK